MIAVHEEIAVRAWLTARLRGAAALAGVPVRESPLPLGTTLPAITLDRYTGSDVNGVGAVRLFTRYQWLVRVVGVVESYADLATLAQAVDDALVNHASANPSGGRVGTCYRDEPFSDTTVEPGGATYLRLGGLYRLNVQGV